MPDDPTAPTDLGELAELVAHVLSRHHEAHQRDLPRLQALARERGTAAAALAAHLAVMSDALPQHMFKEEMRLFPMMEHGDGTLIGILIDDLEAEHRVHEDAVARLLALIEGLPDNAPAGGGEDPLRGGVRRFVADLAEHVCLEDELLFPRFAAAPRGAAVMP